MCEIKEIKTDDFEGFFFKAGQEAFNALVKFVNEDNDILTTAWKEFQNYNSSISDWIKTNKDKKEKENIINLLNAINKFVSYCDVNALSKDPDGTSFQENIEGAKKIKDNLMKINNSDNPPNKLSIAKAFVRQNTWVKNIIKYLKGEEVSPSVKNAIEYFKDPENRFPILSEGHRKKIIEHYLKDKEENEEFDFDKALKLHAEENWNKFIDYNKDPEENSYKNKSNLTYAYSVEIYKHRYEWDCEVDTTLLEKNHNLILTGAPGTGKTFLARQMAEKLTKNNTYSQTNNEKENNPIGFVQFHPSYDYTDFVEGLRPHEKDGNIVFKRENGVFKEFCKKAIENEKNKYVFIIDEINRGEISKIFGELFFSIDPGYRVKRKEATQSNANTKNQEETNKIIKVDTQYKNMIPDDDPFKKGFYVPDNVYIIGTMNDIDRSVESMDFAFRRRFAFQEITAEDTMDSILYQLGDDETIAINKMRAINNTLDKLGLNSNYHIGAAYFKKIENYKNKGKWDQLWNLHLKGTLFEYFRGEPEADKKLKELKEAYKNAGEN